jgi:hypothetical protein
MPKAANRSLEAWRGNTVRLHLHEMDLDLIDNVLSVDPEMRVVAFLGGEARKRGVTYPVTGVEELTELLAGEKFELGGHRIDVATVTHALQPEWFPLAHEGELLSVIHLGLRRCQAERATVVGAALRALQGRPKKPRQEATAKSKSAKTGKARGG